MNIIFEIVGVAVASMACHLLTIFLFSYGDNKLEETSCVLGFMEAVAIGCLLYFR